MIEVRRYDQKIIRADPINEKDREKAWLEYIKRAAPAAIKEEMEGAKRHECAV